MIPGDSASDCGDSYDLNRFISAQEGVYDRALAESRGGLKRTHWMWYIFPQIDGLVHSPTTRHYSIKSPEEARQYLEASNGTLLLTLRCAAEDSSLSLSQRWVRGG